MAETQITGKQRASRIPLDYYKKPDRIVRWKLLLSAILFGAALLWMVSALVAGKHGVLGSKRFSHGPVAEKHAAFENDCAQCHVDFALLKGRDKEGVFATDKKCQECHLNGTLAVHHANQKNDMTPNCGNCHRDHFGANVNLNKVADASCTGCHRDLNASMTSGTAAYANNVADFVSEHPQFRPVAKKEDPGKLKFNHKYHMTEGIVLSPGAKAFTLGDIKDPVAKERFRYPGQQDANAVRLTCTSCHQPDDAAPATVSKPEFGGDVTDAWKEGLQKYFENKQSRRGQRLASGELPPQRKPGAYMKAINYEVHCAACHTLTFDKDIEPVPHRLGHELQPPQLKEWVTQKYDALTATVKPDTRPTALIPLPGQKPGQKVGLPSGTKAERITLALRTLLENKKVCGECHMDARGGDLTLATTNIAKTDVPKEWFLHARFDHRAHAHRDIDCKQCHEAAYPTNNERDLLSAYAMPRKGAEDVMIPGIDNCRQCHSPKPSQPNQQARHDCSECHSYHQGVPRGERAEVCPDRRHRDLESLLRPLVR